MISNDSLYVSGLELPHYIALGISIFPCRHVSFLCSAVIKAILVLIHI